MKLKQFLVDAVLERLIPLQRLESYLMSCAGTVAARREPLIIGVTGSVGKSTTTAMIAAALSHPQAERLIGRVGCTIGNVNDNVGVSATLLGFDPAFDFASLPWSYPGRLMMLTETTARALNALTRRYPNVMVLEFGVGSTADLHRLVTIAPPKISVVTRIGAAHLEELKSLEGVVHEKSALVRAVPPSGLVILGQEHDYVAQLERAARAPVVKVAGTGLELSRNITRVVCRHLGIPEEAVEFALREFKVPQGRLSRLEFPGMTIIDDTYNANPLSMKLGLDTLAASAKPGQRRVAILGFMAELGEDSPRYHEDIGGYARSRADVLIGVGELSKYYHPDVWLESADSCAERIEDLLRSGDCVLLKGSASTRLGDVVKRLRTTLEKLDSQQWSADPRQRS